MDASKSRSLSMIKFVPFYSTKRLQLQVRLLSDIYNLTIYNASLWIRKIYFVNNLRTAKYFLIIPFVIR